MHMIGNELSKVDYIEADSPYCKIFFQSGKMEEVRTTIKQLGFIELIDELYDRAVNLIISAEAPPSDLYLGTRLSMPFERTISRLQEMASEEYLARPHLP